MPRQRLSPFVSVHSLHVNPIAPTAPVAALLLARKCISVK